MIHAITVTYRMNQMRDGTRILVINPPSASSSIDSLHDEALIFRDNTAFAFMAKWVRLYKDQIVYSYEASPEHQDLYRKYTCDTL